MVEAKVLMAPAEENDVISKEGARNGEWVKISMRKVYTLLEMEDNDDRKTYLDYLCSNLNYVKEQRNNLLSKHRDLVHELNACKEQLLVLKQAKLDFLTMQHVNTEILKENKNLKTKLKELTTITETWLNNSNKVNQCISEQILSQKKRIIGVDQLTEDPSSSGQKDLVFVKSSAGDTKVSIPGVERPWLFEAEGFILPNHDTSRILPSESQRNTTDPSIAKLDGVEPISGQKTIKSILRSKSTLKFETLKGVIINKPSSTPAKGNKSSSASKVNSAPAGKLKSVKIEDDPPLAICERIDHRACDHAEYISTMNMSQHLKSIGSPSGTYDSTDRSAQGTRLVLSRFTPGTDNAEQPRPKVVFGDDSTCTTEGYGFIKCNGIVFTKLAFVNGVKYNLISISQLYDAKYIVQFDEKRGTLFNSNKEVVMIAPRCDIRKPIWYLDSGCSRHMTGVKSYLHKYAEQPRPKVVFGDDSTCTTEGYGFIKCNGIVFTKLAFVNGVKYNLISISQLYDAKYIVQFDEKRGTLFNSNKEVVMIAPRHKRLAHLNFKTINKLVKQNLVIGLPSLVYSKHKPCSSCEKGKLHKASFKTKQASSIKKCLHLLHMDLFGPVIPRSINHEKYTLVIVDEYSRYIWVYFLKKKSQAPEIIMSFIKRVENQNDIKVKQLRTDNGTEFRNSILVNSCDEKGISQNFSSPYTPEQNVVAERKNRTLIEAARTMLLGSRIPNINFLHVFGCPVYIYNHKDHLGKFDEKADDGYLLGYSLVSKAFRVFNTRRQQTKETYHITFDESPDAIKFSKPSVDNINIVENERYPPDEYLHPYEPS
ncbi:retrovirus-related pol polyprotein from transposon TNT 1-94 [Tanacetum coccineum]